jgi:gamma-glutamylcyclotransferase (GGCT)/AIG2-like uncharacterized protein YtfP
MTKLKTTDIDFSKGPEAEDFALVAVYGSLRKGLHNYKALDMEEEEFLGEFDTPPVYSLYAVCPSFPGLKEEGTTSIKMEVYQVGLEKLDDLNGLEGYYGPDAATNMYNRTTISTPWGEAYTYIYNSAVKESNLIENGDWKDYYTMNQLVNKN